LEETVQLRPNVNKWLNDMESTERLNDPLEVQLPFLAMPHDGVMAMTRP
jgi:hypothetical protein